MYGDVLLHLGLDLRDPLLKRSLTVTESGFQFFRLCPKFVISKLNTSYSHKTIIVVDYLTNLMIIKDIYNY